MYTNILKKLKDVISSKYILTSTILVIIVCICKFIPVPMPCSTDNPKCATNERGDQMNWIMYLSRAPFCSFFAPWNNEISFRLWALD